MQRHSEKQTGAYAEGCFDLIPREIVPSRMMDGRTFWLSRTKVVSGGAFLAFGVAAQLLLRPKIRGPYGAG